MSLRSDIKQRLSFVWVMLQGYARSRMPDEWANSRVARAGQMGRVITVVTIGIVGIIGILIYDTVLDALGDPSGTNAENRTALENSTVNVTSGFGDALDLLPVLMIVLIAGLVISVVQRLR